MCRMAVRGRLMRIFFAAWRALIQEMVVRYLEEENERLSKMVGGDAKSIWKMRKADLVRTAETELGMNRAAAEKETVGQLRLLIREYREMQEYIRAAHKLPKGLTRMTHAELLHTCEQWGVATEDSGKRLGINTREQMIRDIKLMAEMQPTSSTSEMATSMDI